MQLLEESARLLYKEWFVHLRFPGHEHVKITDGVPEGWEKGSVKDLAVVKSGYAFKSKDWKSEGNPVIKIKNITDDYRVDTSDCQCIDDNVAEKAGRFRLCASDLLIAMTGATVGKVGIMPVTKGRYYLNQRVGKFFLNEERKAGYFLFCASTDKAFHSQILNLAGGAAQPNILGSQIESIELLIPQDSIMSEFNEAVRPIFEQRLYLCQQNLQLAEARDLLLPRLMNGEIEV